MHRRTIIEHRKYIIDVAYHRTVPYAMIITVNKVHFQHRNNKTDRTVDAYRQTDRRKVANATKQIDRNTAYRKTLLEVNKCNNDKHANERLNATINDK